MLAALRRLFVGSWLGRIVALLIFASFAVWGVGGFVTNLGGVSAGSVARIGDRTISTDEFDRAYQRALAQVAANQKLSDPTQLPFGERRQLAVQALQQLVTEAVVAEGANRAGVVVPDAAVREQIFAEKAFLGSDGKFDRTLFNQRIQAAGFTEDELVRLFREQLAATGLIEPIRVGAHAPQILVRRAFDYAAEGRVLDMVTIPFSDVPAPAAPDEAALRRYYTENKDSFRSPEYRRIKLVVLSPQTIGHSIDVSEADEKKAYDELVTRYQVPEKRSVQVLIVPEQAAATRLADLWKSGAGWEQLQSTDKSATPVALDAATQAGIPSPDLARLVFAAAPDTVVGPDKTEAGWVVLRVTKVLPAENHSFAEVRDQLHDMIGGQRGAAELSARVEKLQDAIAGGGLDAIPGDIGAAAAEGTLDAEGNTPAGEPAPVPGSDALRKAVLGAAFATGKGDSPTLTQGPDSSWYALKVEDVVPAKPIPFEQAEDKVRAAWTKAAIRRAAEAQAAALYHQVDGAGGLAKLNPAPAGLQNGLLVHRDQAPGPVPSNVAQLAFGLAPGKSTMQEEPDGFVVATVAGIRPADPSTQALGWSRTQQGLDAALADDLETSYVQALRGRVKPKIDGKAIEGVLGPVGGGGS